MPLELTKERAEAVASRFWAKVDRSGDGCWLWRATRTAGGYGGIGFCCDKQRTMFMAHRVSYVLHHGEIPPGHFVMHTCDNPSCVNPAHLRAGTPAENSADMTRKGRSFKPKGELHPHSKITAEDVREIRRLAAQGRLTQREISWQFGMNEAAISQIIHRLRWAHVT